MCGLRSRLRMSASWWKRSSTSCDPPSIGCTTLTATGAPAGSRARIERAKPPRPHIFSSRWRRPSVRARALRSRDRRCSPWPSRSGAGDPACARRTSCAARVLRRPAAASRDCQYKSPARTAALDLIRNGSICALGVHPDCSLSGTVALTSPFREDDPCRRRSWSASATGRDRWQPVLDPALASNAAVAAMDGTTG